MEPKTIFHHVALSVKTLEESIKWYDDVFGLKVITRMTMPHNGTVILSLNFSKSPMRIRSPRSEVIRIRII